MMYRRKVTVFIIAVVLASVLFATVTAVSASTFLPDSPGLLVAQASAGSGQQTGKLIPSKVGETRTYRITWQGRLTGYSRYNLEKILELGGEKFYKFTSRSELKIGMGEIQHLTYKSNMTVRSGDYTPTAFSCVQKQGITEMGVDCIISENLVAQSNITEATERSALVTFDDGKSPYVMMNNLWGRLDTLVEHTASLIRSGKTGRIYVYDPVLQQAGYMNLTRGGLEPVEYNGKKANATSYKLKDQSGTILLLIWVDSAGTILRMQEPGGGIAFELADDARTVKAFEKAAGVDIWEDRVAQVEYYLSNPKEITSLNLKVALKGKHLLTEDPINPGVKQVFTGTRTAESLEGEFLVETSPVTLSNALSFPVPEGLPAELGSFTKPELGIESDNDFINNKSLEITWQSKDAAEAARKIASWVSTSIPYGIALPSAKMTLTNEQGNSESKALLAIALCRAVGIPARRAGGIVFSNGAFIPHYWFEAYVGDGRWLALDPTFNETERLNATHIKLFSRGEIWSLQASVIDYGPKPPEVVSFINRELAWPVGEERVYAVKKGGEKVGEEIARITETTVIDKKEAYHMKLSTLLTIGEKEIACSGSYWTTPQGLPLRFVKEVTDGTLKENQQLTVNEGMINQEGKTGSGEFRRKIPVSRGIYLTDSLFLSQWALLGGQFHNPEIGKSFLFHVFIPETMTTRSIQAQVKTIESVEAAGKIWDSYRIDTNGGITFWLEKDSGRVLKISFAEEQVELELVTTRFRIE